MTSPATPAGTTKQTRQGIRPDLATLVARFSAELRKAGVAVAPDQTMRLARLIELGAPTDIDELYWCARVSLVRSTTDIPAFDAIFALVFKGMTDIAEFRGQGQPAQPTEPAAHTPQPAAPAVASGGSHPAPVQASLRRAGDEGAESVTGQLPVLASNLEQLKHADLARVSPAELAELAPLLRQLLTEPPLRTSRRHERTRHGRRLDVRASLRRSTRSGGDPAMPIHRARAERPRDIVALLDISGSMQPYARAYLQLLWGAAARAHAEVFVFGTRLTRLTRALRTGSADLALDRAAAIMPDWSGGTRIGESLQSFMDTYGRRGMAHGAVVLIVSDGWERDDPERLATQMAALRRRAYRIVWANPRVAAPGFAPSTGGMAAAAPHIDTLVSGHSVHALIEVVRALGGAGPSAAIGQPASRHGSRP
jgi:uncharacterized protein